jgi:hypothetical protein
MDNPILNVGPGQLKRRTKIAFAILISGLLLMTGFFLAVEHSALENKIPWPLRRVLQFNAAVGEKFVNPDRVDIKKFASPLKEEDARVNGDIGLQGAVDLDKWNITVLTPSGPAGGEVKNVFTLNDITKLPKTEETTQFKCIEGWSEVMSFGGTRFSEFLKFYHLGTRTGQEPDLQKRPQDLFRYVGLETPDGKYYVSIDMKSLMSPEALLAYEQNGEALTDEHGAPLRLYIPNKYGVKSLKRIGKIRFSDNPMPDFWGEHGYDWFIGL